MLKPARFRSSFVPTEQVKERPPFWWLRWVPAALLVSVFLYLGYIVGRVAIIPVLASFAIAYVLNPITEQLAKRGFARPLSAILSILVVTLCVVTFFWFVIPDLWQQASGIGDSLFRNFTDANARKIQLKIHQFSPVLDRMIGHRVYLFMRNPSALMETSQAWATGTMGGFLETAATIVDMLVVPFFVFYILVDFPRWRDSTEDLIPQRFRDPFSRLFDEVGRILQSYVLGQILIAMLMGCMYAVGFAFLGVPAWAGIAALSGFLNVIPYVGTISGLLLASGFTLAHGGTLWQVGGVAAIFVAVQCIEGYYLTPRILGGRLRLHPMAVFLTLLIGGKLFGFLGILLAVPVTAVLQVFLKFLREIYKTSYYYHDGDATLEEAPTEAPDVIAKAADNVLAEQVEEQSGEELLSPPKMDDDQAARETISPNV